MGKTVGIIFGVLFVFWIFAFISRKARLIALPKAVGDRMNDSSEWKELSGFFANKGIPQNEIIKSQTSILTYTIQRMVQLTNITKITSDNLDIVDKFIRIASKNAACALAEKYNYDQKELPAQHLWQEFPEGD